MMRRTRPPLLLALALASAASAAAQSATPAAPADILVILGLRNDLPDTKKYRPWRDYRLGMGVRGRLAQMAAASGRFVLLEEHALASSVGDALGGYWLRETSAADPRRLAEAAGAAWVLYGDLSEVGVRRSRTSGPVGRISWRYRVRLRVCLDSSLSGELCRQAEGIAKTKKLSAGFEYRGDDFTWDQAGPAEAVAAALSDAFGAVLGAAAAHLGRPGGWRPRLAAGDPLPVYVAGFGLSRAVAGTYPELADSQVGWGLCQRIVDALFDSGRFLFLEEKAEVVERMAALLRRRTAPEAPAPEEADWLLYGEVVDLHVARREKISRAAAEHETRITLQIRLLERASGRFYPAAATGRHVARLTGWKGGRAIDDLDERSVALATDDAVRRAAEALLGTL